MLSTTVPIQASDPEVPVGKYFYLFVKFHLVNEWWYELKNLVVLEY